MEEKILKGIEQQRAGGGRTKLGDAVTYAEGITRLLGKVKGVTRIDAAGSLRRMKETVGDIDILVTSPSRPAAVMGPSRARWPPGRREGPSGGTT